MKWTEKLLIDLEDSLHVTVQIRRWTDQRTHLLPTAFLVSLGELEQKLESLKQKIRMKSF